MATFEHLPHACESMVWMLERANSPMMYWDALREYNLDLGDSSAMAVLYCPFDGTERPLSLRDEWFERLDALGIEGVLRSSDPLVPLHLRTGAWWRNGSSL
jgi:hypothetical protein